MDINKLLPNGGFTLPDGRLLDANDLAFIGLIMVTVSLETTTRIVRENWENFKNGN